MSGMDELDINERLILSDKNDYVPQRYATNLKEGVDISRLQDGLTFEVDQDNRFPRDSDDEDVDNYFDEEELFQLLNHEALGVDSNDEEDDGTETPFEQIAKDMSPLVDDNGVLKKILRPGVGPVVTKTSTLRFHYNAYKEYCDEPYDSSRFRGKPENVTIGGGAFLGLDIALASMRKTELAKFLFKKEYVFKEMGCEPRVPGETVLWEIELLNVVDHGVEDINDMPKGDKRKATFEHLLLYANGHKEMGNDFYKRKQMHQAVSKYMKAIKMLEECSLHDANEEREMNELLLKLYSNMSQCALELGQSARAIKYARKVLYIDPNNVKALFRLGKAFMKESEFDRARSFFLKALHKEPNNREIKNGIVELNRNVEKFKAIEKENCQEMMRRYLKTDESGSSAKGNSSTSGISEDLKQTMSKKLSDFLADSSIIEMVLPSSLTEKEMLFVQQTAVDMGLKAEVKQVTGNKQLVVRKQ